MNPIAKMLLDMARFYAYELEERQLEMYVDALSGFPLEKVLGACRAYVKNPKNEKFPIPPHKVMIAYLPSEPDSRALSVEASSRVVAAVTKFGWNNGSRAKEYIGELGWLAVMRLGGWSHLCQNLGLSLNVTVIQAQVRDLCEATLKLGDADIHDHPPALPSRRESDLVRIGSGGEE